MPAADIRVFADPEALARGGAAWLCETALKSSGPFAVALSGGSTPKRLYELLADDFVASFPWHRVHWFWGDERCVPHDAANSNFRMVREAMLSLAPVPAENVHSIPTSTTPDDDAPAYERALQRYYGAAELDSTRPLFDVVLLGLGEDGHTASLFPATAALGERLHWTAAVIGAQPEARITLTYPALESSRETVFLVSGLAKRDILARVWRGDDVPAARLHPQGALHWFIDRAADPRG